MKMVASDAVFLEVATMLSSGKCSLSCGNFMFGTIRDTLCKVEELLALTITGQQVGEEERWERGSGNDTEFSCIVALGCHWRATRENVRVGWLRDYDINKLRSMLEVLVGRSFW